MRSGSALNRSTDTPERWDAAHGQGHTPPRSQAANVKINARRLGRLLTSVWPKRRNGAQRRQLTKTPRSLGLTEGLMLGPVHYMSPQQAREAANATASGHLGIRLRALRDAERTRGFGGNTVSDTIAPR